MSKYFIHIKDGDWFFADTEGVEVAVQQEIHPYIEQTVLDIVGDEGGWTADDLREVEVTDETGETVLTVPFRAIAAPH